MTLPLELHFVLGTGRCGSTLVHEVLCQHDDVAFLSNLEDLAVPPAQWPSRVAGAYRRMPPWVTEKGRARFAPSEGYRALAREVSPILENSDRDLVGADATPWLNERLARFFISARRARPRAASTSTSSPDGPEPASSTPCSRMPATST